MTHQALTEVLDAYEAGQFARNYATLAVHHCQLYAAEAHKIKRLINCGVSIHPALALSSDAQRRESNAMRLAFIGILRGYGHHEGFRDGYEGAVK